MNKESIAKTKLNGRCDKFTLVYRPHDLTYRLDIFIDDKVIPFLICEEDFGYELSHIASMDLRSINVCEPEQSFYNADEVAIDNQIEDFKHANIMPARIGFRSYRSSRRDINTSTTLAFLGGYCG